MTKIIVKSLRVVAGMYIVPIGLDSLATGYYPRMVPDPRILHLRVVAAGGGIIALALA
jgi:hypothetical protein